MKKLLPQIFFLVLVLGTAVMMSQCKSVGKKLASGAVLGIKEEQTAEYIENMISKIVSNSRNQLLSDTTTQKIDSLMTQVLFQLKGGLDTMTVSIRDSLLGEYTGLKIKRMLVLAGEGLNITMSELRENLLGARTKILVAQLRTELLGDSTLMAVAALRDELLGPKTKAKIDSLLKSSIETISIGFENDIKPQIKDTLNSAGKTVEKTVSTVSWALGILALVLVGAVAFIWRKFTTRKRIMKILTQEIDAIKDQEQYDQLVKQISQRTKQENVEGSFKKILKQDALYQQEEWANKDKLLLKETIEAMHSKLNEEDLQSITKSLAAKGLEGHLKSVKGRTN